MATEALTVNSHDPQLLKYLANYSAMIDDHTRAVRYLNEELRQAKFDKDALFEAALIFNHFGERGTSLEWLGKALRAGVSREQVLQQPDLDNLHNDPRFQELLKLNSSGPNHGK